MKKILFFLLASFAMVHVLGQDKTRARVEIIIPKADMVAEFEKGLAAHVQKFHPKATDPVTVYMVSSGSRSGEYHFVQGPMSWADIAGKQYTGEHSDDWTKNVAKFTKSSETHFYNFNPENSFNVSEDELEWSIISFITLNGGTASTYQQLLKTRVDALTKAKDGRSFAIYAHSFAGRDNEHNYVNVSPLKGGLKDLDAQLFVPMSKILNDNIGPNAAVDDNKGVEVSIKKVETMLVRRMANLSSK